MGSDERMNIPTRAAGVPIAVAVRTVSCWDRRCRRGGGADSSPEPPSKLLDLAAGSSPARPTCSAATSSLPCSVASSGGVIAPFIMLTEAASRDAAPMGCGAHGMRDPWHAGPMYPALVDAVLFGPRVDLAQVALLAGRGAATGSRACRLAAANVKKP